jgi:guanylate kinase
LISRLLAADSNLWLSRSWTTRARRPGEAVDAYNWVDRETFLRRVQADGFLEWAHVIDDLYGTPRPEAPPGKDVLLEIDVQGAKQILESDPSALVVLVRAPSEEAQIARLRGRGDPEAHVQRRVALGRVEEAEGMKITPHVVVNDDVDATVSQLLAIIRNARRAVAPRPPRS